MLSQRLCQNFRTQTFRGKKSTPKSNAIPEALREFQKLKLLRDRLDFGGGLSAAKVLISEISGKPLG
jgi:hypothetical protein